MKMPVKLSFAVAGAIALLVLGNCVFEEAQPLSDGRDQPQNADEIAFVKTVLNDLQARSIENNREYCGYIGVDESGAFTATPAKRGQRGGCLANLPPEGMEVLASYHTHGAFSVGYDSEVPSPNDLEADIQENVDGYISTPGGRLWFNDASEGLATQICGTMCLTADPTYYDDTTLPPVQASYDLDGLYARAE